jgi:2-aminoethylphosphonate-pyruvate transaminase
VDGFDLVYKMSDRNNPYILLTPGPLSTSDTVKRAMLMDWCTWDQDYNDIVQEIRRSITTLATRGTDYSSVLIQGSGTFCVEAALGSFLPSTGQLLILSNGAYGERIVKIAEILRIDHLVYRVAEKKRHNIVEINKLLENNPKITHVVMVHCETTTGMLNPISEVSSLLRSKGKIFILDAMSSFGGIPLDMVKDRVDVLISSANKCIQGVPGFGFIIAARELLEQTKGNARSLALDVYDQWKTMEEYNGKWRFTSPTHTVRAFYQALKELETEGGVGARYERYRKNHQVLVNGLNRLGFRCYLSSDYQSPIITSFLDPNDQAFEFKVFYQKLKAQGFVIYPGKVTDANTFRIGSIGDVNPQDMDRLIAAIEKSIYWKQNEIKTYSI